MNLIHILNNQHKVLGLNARYLEFIRPNNLSVAVEIADNKIKTKQVLSAAEIPTPDLIAVIRNFQEMHNFDFESLPKSFVLKPVNGVEGGGIEIFYNRKNGEWIKSSGVKVSVDQLKESMRDILDGRYSLHREPDMAMIEERVKAHKAFRNYTYKGTPDIRIVVYNNIPIMSYIRIPTKESDGRANLQIGAIGAAIDIAVGKTTTAIKGKKGRVDQIPHTGMRVSGLEIPFWDEILTYAIKAQRATGLGYAGVDFLIDREQGPMIVELNARPGLSIQLAAKDGLRRRLEKARGLKVKTIKQGIRLGKDMFGGEIEEGVENITGKKVLGIIQSCLLEGKDKNRKTVKVKLDTGATRTSISRELAIELGYGDAINFADEILSQLPEFSSLSEIKHYASEQKLNSRLEQHEDIVGTIIIKASSGISYRIQVPIILKIDGLEVSTLANITPREDLAYSAIIGRKDMQDFLIDPSKTL